MAEQRRLYPPRGNRLRSCVAAIGSPTQPPVLLAGWGIGRWFAGGGGRARVVQFCVVTMCVALFIMMRKLVISGQWSVVSKPTDH